MTLPMSRPPKAPRANGAAIKRWRVPDSAENTAPPPDTMASTPKEVATIDCAERSVYRLKAGTRTKPPPTEDTTPASKPLDQQTLLQITEKVVDPANLSPEHLEEVEAFLAAIDANDDVQNVYVGLAG